MKIALRDINIEEVVLKPEARIGPGLNWYATTVIYTGMDIRLKIILVNSCLLSKSFCYWRWDGKSGLYIWSENSCRGQWEWEDHGINHLIFGNQSNPIRFGRTNQYCIICNPASPIPTNQCGINETTQAWGDFKMCFLKLWACLSASISYRNIGVVWYCFIVFAFVSGTYFLKTYFCWNKNRRNIFFFSLKK